MPIARLHWQHTVNSISFADRTMAHSGLDGNADFGNAPWREF